MKWAVRYVLELADGLPADPAIFNTVLPPGMWQPGQELLVGSALRKFRIAAIGELEERGYEHAHGLWIVEPVGRC